MADTKNKRIKYCLVNSCQYFRGATDVKMFRYISKIHIKDSVFPSNMVSFIFLTFTYNGFLRFLSSID